ncbi:hypothetical protein JCM8097_009301 [Rhodosporidiobolus ruineniae]
MKTTAALFAAASLAVSAFAAPTLQVRAPIPITGSYQDSDPAVVYLPEGAWTHLTGQNETTHNGGTESYTQDPSGSVDVPYDPRAEHFYVYAARKKDRGYFDVIYAGQVIGVGDAHGDCEGDNCQWEQVFRTTNLPYADGYGTVTIKNREYDSRVGGTPYLGFDWATWEENLEA